MTQQINETLPSLLQNLRTIAENGKYREKKEVIETLESLSWFDNFEEEFHIRRTELIEELKNEVEN